MDTGTRTAIKHIFPVPDLQAHTKHLGHPLIFNHNDRNRAYSFIHNKFKAKLTTVRANKLNHARRLTYIQSVLASIPVYYMSTVLFSKSFLHQITSTIRKFWWIGVQEDGPTSPIAYRSWYDICQSKENGGLGIRDLETVNKSLIIHAAYNIANEKNPFLTAVLKAKYYPNTSFWKSSTSTTKSIFWSFVLQVKGDLQSNVTYQLHAENTSIWAAPWCPIWDSIHDHLKLPVTVPSLPATAADLWLCNTRQWNMPLLSNIFHDSAVQAITSTQPIPSERRDILRWKPSRNGVCSAKEIYKVLSAANTVQLPQQGSQSITAMSTQILNRAWKSKSLPPLIKTFTWRLVRNALATADRAGRYSNIPQHCSTCGALETDSHLFFHCLLPTQVWLSFTPSIRTEDIPSEQDGIQNSLQYIISHNTNDVTFTTALFTLWYLWKPGTISILTGRDGLQHRFTTLYKPT